MNSLLTGIANSLAQKLLFENAFSVVSEISEPEWKEKATHFIAVELASQGELELAERLVREMSEDRHREPVLAKICEYLAREGKFDEALLRSREIANSYRSSEVTKLIERIRDGTPTPLEQLTGSMHDRIHTLTAFSSNGTYDSAILAIVAAKAGDPATASKHIRDFVGDSNTFDFNPRKS